MTELSQSPSSQAHTPRRHPRLDFDPDCYCISGPGGRVRPIKEASITKLRQHPRQAAIMALVSGGKTSGSEAVSPDVLIARPRRRLQTPRETSLGWMDERECGETWAAECDATSTGCRVPMLQILQIVSATATLCEGHFISPSVGQSVCLPFSSAAIGPNITLSPFLLSLFIPRPEEALRHERLRMDASP